MNLDDVLARLGAMPEADRDQLRKDVLERQSGIKWVPNPGPQTEAYFCAADILLYGGQGGGGKSDLIAGLALTAHKNSLVMRRQYTDLGAMIDRVLAINGTRDGFNGSPPPKLRTDGRLIDFGAAAKPDDEQHWQGQAHDLLGIDEVTQFLEAQVRFLMGWIRPRDEADLDIRCRSVLASNPPLSADGEWIVGMFRPWLDPMYPDRAEHGELRWFLVDPDGKDVEAGGPDDVREWDGKAYRPMSRTFIPAKLSDNPTLARTNYQAALDAMPEPIRSAIRDGNFMAAREDSAWQVIPTPWILAANERWREGKPKDVPMTAVGVDVARGGRDETVVAPRFDRWFDTLTVVPGRETPDGPSVVALTAGKLRDGAVVGLDSIGVGADAETAFKNTGMSLDSLNGATRSNRLTRDKNFGFVTKRSEMWWQLRESLDPDYGVGLALPPDPTLQADLTAPTYEVRPGKPPKIYVESKEGMIKRLGRSPDRGDAVVYAWAAKLKPREEPSGRSSGGSAHGWLGG